MADNDLDKYLEDIGISVDEDEEPQIPQAREEDEELVVSPPLLLEGDARERTESFLVNLLLNFDPSYAVEITAADDDEIHAEIFGGDAAKVIGRGGRTLVALEYITNAVINRAEGGPNVRVSIDVGGYKRRRDDRLRETAFKAADRVRKTGEPVELEPMSGAERRVIHVALAEEEGVSTESSGEGRGRRVVVLPT